MIKRLTSILLAAAVVTLPAAAKPATLFQRGTSPLVSFRLLFMTGAASDPVGKEGLAALTAAMLAEGGTRTLSYDQIVEALYPIASSVRWQIDKEMTVFSGTAHIETVDRYYGLLKDMLLDPGFRADDFKRLQEEAINFLKVDLRESNDEELGKEYLYNIVYAGHRYAHHNIGKVSSLQKLTVQDVRDFYRNNYTQANLIIGLAGGYPQGFEQKVEADFAKLPAGSPRASGGEEMTAPKLAPGTRIEIVERDTRSTAISMGFPIEINRSSKDWPALAVAASYLGQHRSSNSHLYQRLREARGLNYGDYAYIEYFPRGMFQFTPDPNLGRRQQIFQIWIRPVEPKNGLFALRGALFEFDKFVREGLSVEDFEGARDFLMKYSNILTQTQDLRLGYALDSRYYGIPEFTTYMKEQLSRLTREDVNRAIQKYLKTDRMRIVIITKDGASLRDAIVKNEPSPITYNAPKPEEITEEDKTIQAFKIGVKGTDVVLVPIDRVFQ